jgi:acyl-CoA carboxylase subunit beta
MSKNLSPSTITISQENRVCQNCGAAVDFATFSKSSGTCPNCGQLLKINAMERLFLTVDDGSFQELNGDRTSHNILDFPEYDDKLQKGIRQSGLKEAIVTGVCTIMGHKAAIGVMESNFMMGSMGTIVGEKVVLLAEHARINRLPLVIFCASGGARMQEGMLSLMQMTRCSVATKRHSSAGLLYISVLTNPTTAGVAASFAMQSDITLGEPDAVIGFAGRRVIEGTIKEALPDDFQKSEFQLAHGFLDAIVCRSDLRSRLGWLLDFHTRKFTPAKDTQITPGAAAFFRQIDAWERVRQVRSAKRPSSMDYIDKIFEGFFELHGDRNFSDDPAIVAGLGLLKGLPVTIVTEQKGRQIEERMRRNFGMPHPEGYRKALRLARQAEKFNRPVVFLVDTPGAYPGVGAEERGQARAIADNLYELSELGVPMVTIVVGEGGSGGALALSVGDRMYMLENSIYSVITPEGCASILWRDSSKAPQAAESLKLTAGNLLEFGLIDQVIPEGEQLSYDNMDGVCRVIQQTTYQAILALRKLSPGRLIQLRQQKYLDMTRSFMQPVSK